MVSFMFFPKYCAYLLCLISFGVIRKIPRSYNYILCLDQLLVMSLCRFNDIFYP
jgi:hypothetical protein